MRYTLKQANDDAQRLGLYVTYYNAGGNPQWKVASADKPYHALSAGETLFRATSGHLVSAFLEGYDAGVDATVRVVTLARYFISQSTIRDREKNDTIVRRRVYGPEAIRICRELNELGEVFSTNHNNPTEAR